MSSEQQSSLSAVPQEPQQTALAPAPKKRRRTAADKALDALEAETAEELRAGLEQIVAGIAVARGALSAIESIPRELLDRLSAATNALAADFVQLGNPPPNILDSLPPFDALEHRIAGLDGQRGPSPWPGWK